MAKRPVAPPAKPPAAKEPDETDLLLFELAAAVIGDYFVDPDREDEYKIMLRNAKRLTNGPATTLLEEYGMDLPEGECQVRLEALKNWTVFRVSFDGDGFQTAVDATWSFDNVDTSSAKVVKREGDAEVIANWADDFLDHLEEPDLDDEEAASLFDSLEDDDEEDTSFVGDDPKEPPEATSLDRNRIKAIAKRTAKLKDPAVAPEDRMWLELTPQTLPVITEGFIAAASAQGKKRDDKLVTAYQWMLSLQLEFVRYRRDRGWAWAVEMLEDYQRTLIELGEEKAIALEDWFMMAQAMTEARVPVSEEMQTKLAEAGFSGEESASPEEMMTALRGFLDDMAGMVKSPYDVMEAINNSGAVMPATLRGFMATELSLSPHQVLRDAVPLMLLDDEAAVRRDAARALEQTASPGTLSPDALRRTIAMRNWVPPTDRPALDSAIRAARLAGVEIGAWPKPTADLEFHATLVDGSGAQSVLVVSRAGKIGLFAGLLLRHGTGVVDAWIEADLPRSKASRMLKDALSSAVFTRVERPYVDLLVQHGIAAGIATGTMPPEGLLQTAEFIAGSEWQDRGLDVTAEAERLFQTLNGRDRSSDGLLALHERGLDWMKDDPLLASWYEDGPEVRKALTEPRRSRAAMLEAAMDDILPPHRMEWAERFLLMALWCEASAEARYRGRAPELIAIAHALTTDAPLDTIPVMGLIARQTVNEAIEGGW